MKPLLPYCENVDSEPIGENIIGIRPDEKWEDAKKRFILEKRTKKIRKILEIKKGSD